MTSKLICKGRICFLFHCTLSDTHDFSFTIICCDILPYTMTVGCLGCWYVQVYRNRLGLIRFHLTRSFIFDICSVYPHGRRSIYALLLGIASYLFLSVSMWNCVYVKIDGYLDAESPFIERVSTKVRLTRMVELATKVSTSSLISNHSMIHQ